MIGELCLTCGKVISEFSTENKKEVFEHTGQCSICQESPMGLLR